MTSRELFTIRIGIVKFQVLTAAIMRFWGVETCGIVETQESFRGTYYIHQIIVLTMEAVNTYETLVN
jgi:hypothetical protein